MSLAGGWIEVATSFRPADEVVISIRPVSVFATGPGSEAEQLKAGLRGRWREAARAVMVLLSLRGLPPSQIAELLDCHPATVRRWIGRFNAEGAAGLADRPRCGRPRLGGRQLASRVVALVARPGPWTLPRIRRYLGWPQVSMRTLYRRVRLVAVWRRPKLTARGDPAHDHVVAQIVARLLELPRRAVVLAEDETHLNLLPHVRASWTLRTARPQIPTPGTNRQVTVYGAIEVTTGAWVYRLGRRCAADFIAFLGMLEQAFPRAPVIVVICDNDSIHHARKVTAYLEEHPRLELLYGARYSPHDNPVERADEVEEHYKEGTVPDAPVEPSATGRRRNRKPAAKKPCSRAKDINFRPEGIPSLRDFATEKDPASNHERNLVAVYYLEEFLAIDSIEVGHVLAAYTECGWRSPNDPDNSLSVTASRKGWLETSDRKAIRITHLGRNTVQYDLPRSSATKSA